MCHVVLRAACCRLVLMRLGCGMAVASRLLAVIEPTDDTVIAVKERAAAYSGVQFGRSAVAHYLPPLPDAARGQDAKARLWFSVAATKPYRDLGPLYPAPLSGDRRAAEKGLAIALPAGSSSFPAP
jgi:hypothetical protein